ncbi:hypothetical protein ACS0TY_004420 [Phlomoides rotata]
MLVESVGAQRICDVIVVDWRSWLPPGRVIMLGGDFMAMKSIIILGTAIFSNGETLPSVIEGRDLKPQKIVREVGGNVKDFGNGRLEKEIRKLKKENHLLKL